MKVFNLYQSVKATRPSNSVSLEQLIELIRSGGNNKALIEELRTLNKGESRYTQIKQQLVAVTLNAAFSGERKITADYNPTGLLYIDVDADLFNDEIDVAAVNSTSPLAYWRSVGGRGLGILYSYSGNFNAAFEGKSKELAAVGIQADKACKDITRLNILSYDPNLFYNPDAPVTHYEAILEPSRGVTEASGTYSVDIDTAYHVLKAAVRKASEEGIEWVDGQKHYFHIRVLSFLISFGVDSKDAFTLLANEYPSEKLGQRIHSCYSDWEAQAGTLDWNATSVGSAIFTKVKKYPELTSDNVEKVDVRYLPSVYNRFQLIKSAKNTGKTTYLRSWVAEMLRQLSGITNVLIVTDRISVAQKVAADNPGYRCYLDSGVDLSAATRGNNYITTVNSLRKYPRHLYPTTLIVYEECESVIGSLSVAATMQDYRHEAFNAVETSLHLCPAVLASSADLSYRSCNFLSSHIKENVNYTEGYLLINSYKPAQGQNWRNVVGSSAQCCVSVIADLQTGKRVHLASSTKIEAANMYSLIQKAGFSEGLLITDETKNNTDVLAFFADPDASKYQYIVSSPSLETGVSIEVGTFDKVVYCQTTITQNATAIMQSVTRDRSNCPREFWVDYSMARKAEGELPDSDYLYNSYLRNLHLGTNAKYGVVAEEDTFSAAHSFKLSKPGLARLRLMAEYTAHDLLEKSDILAAVTMLAEEEGYSVTFEKCTDEVNTTAHKDNRTVLKEAQLTAVVEADTLSEAAYTSLKGDSNLTQEKQYQMRKYRYSGMVENELTVEDVKVLSSRYFEEVLDVCRGSVDAGYIHYQNRMDTGRGVNLNLGVKVEFITNSLSSLVYSKLPSTTTDSLSLETLLGLASSGFIDKNTFDAFGAHLRANYKGTESLLNVNVNSYDTDAKLAKAMLERIGVASKIKRSNGKTVGYTLDTTVLQYAIKATELYQQRREAQKAKEQAEKVQAEQRQVETLKYLADPLKALSDLSALDNTPNGQRKKGIRGINSFNQEYNYINQEGVLATL